MVPLLVGRDRELAVLAELLNDAIAGRGSFVLAGGEAGIGKTALAEAACRVAVQQEVLVLTGRCFDRSETSAYGPWLSLFERYRPRDDLPPYPMVFAEPGHVDDVGSQASLFRQVLSFLRATTSVKPVMLLLEDVHWADPASLDLLRFLAQNIATLPLLVMVTYRSDEFWRHHPFASLVPLLVRETGARSLDLGPLDRDSLHTLIALRYGVPDVEAVRLAAYLESRTEGNALFVIEVLRSLEEMGVVGEEGDHWHVGDLAQITIPPLLRQVIDGRVGRLDAECQRLLRLAAIIGHDVPLDVWARVADVDEETLLNSLERLVEARILDEVGEGTAVRFVHALIRETLYEGMLQARRRRVHLRVAEVLASLPTPMEDAIAYHFHKAGDSRAAAWHVRAGEQAQRAYAWITASEHYEAALGLMTREGSDGRARSMLLLQLATLRRYQDPHSGIALLIEAERLASGVRDNTLVGLSKRWRGVLRAWDGDEGPGIAELAEGVAILEALPLEERRLHSMLGSALSEAPVSTGRGTLIGWLMHIGRYREAAGMGGHFFAQHAFPVQEFGGSAYRDGLWGLGRAHAALGQVAEAPEMLARARTVYGKAELYGLYSLIATEDLRVVLTFATERLHERRALAAMAEEVLARSSGTLGDTPALLGRVPLLMVEGEWAAVHTLAEHAPARSRYGLWDLFVDDAFASLAYHQGEYDRSWDYVRVVLPEGTATAPGTRRFVTATAAQRLAVALAIDLGDITSAGAWLEAHDRWMTWSGAALGQSEHAALWARYERATGDMAQARVWAERAVTHATDPRQPLALLAAQRLLGEIETATRRFAEAEEHVQAAIVLADTCAAPYERALCLVSLGELRAATGDVTYTRRLVEEARAICIQLDAKPALARANALSSAVARRTPRRPTFPAGLSVREVDVLRLVALGLTNPQVAGQLSVSRRTVEQHLRSIYGKLGVSSRAAATRFAVTNGLA